LLKFCKWNPAELSSLDYRHISDQSGPSPNIRAWIKRMHIYRKLSHLLNKSEIMNKDSLKGIITPHLDISTENHLGCI